MIVNGNNPIIKIVDVERISCEDGVYHVAPREYAVLAFRIRGSVSIAADGKEYFAKANEVLYVPQHMGYTAEYMDNEIVFVHFVTAEDDREIRVFPLTNSEQVYGVFMGLLGLWRSKEPGILIYSMERLYGLLGMLFQKQTQGVLPGYFLEAVSFINANYQDSELNIDRICAKVGIGATTLRQMFRKHYQKSPLEYITDLRLECARRLIASGIPVESAAYESGFNDPKYFARVVKKKLGCTPRSLKTYGK